MARWIVVCEVRRGVGRHLCFPQPNTARPEGGLGARRLRRGDARQRSRIQLGTGTIHQARYTNCPADRDSACLSPVGVPGVWPQRGGPAFFLPFGSPNSSGGGAPELQWRGNHQPPCAL